MLQPEGIYYFPVYKDFFWSLGCQAIGFGKVGSDSLISVRLGFGAIYTILDSGTSMIYVPSTLYYPIIN